jgi:hypothetical protein
MFDLNDRLWDVAVERCNPSNLKIDISVVFKFMHLNCIPINSSTSHLLNDDHFKVILLKFQPIINWRFSGLTRRLVGLSQPHSI